MSQNGFEIDFCRHCRNSLFDLRILKDEIESVAFKSSHTARRSHERIKAGFSACPNACSSPQIKDFGVTAFIVPELDLDKCTSCGKCHEACRENAIDFSDHPEFKENCIGCGDCMRACDRNAIAGKVKLRIMAGGRLGRHPRFALTVKLSETTSEIVKAFRNVVGISERHRKRFSYIEGCVELLISAVNSSPSSQYQIKK